MTQLRHKKQDHLPQYRYKNTDLGWFLFQLSSSKFKAFRSSTRGLYILLDTLGSLDLVMQGYTSSKNTSSRDSRIASLSIPVVSDLGYISSKNTTPRDSRKVSLSIPVVPDLIIRNLYALLKIAQPMKHFLRFYDQTWFSQDQGQLHGQTTPCFKVVKRWGSSFPYLIWSFIDFIIGNSIYHVTGGKKGFLPQVHG